MVVLQSARPRGGGGGGGGVEVSAPDRVTLPPQRVSVRSSGPTLAGKARFNKNVSLKRSHSAVIHQKLQPPGGGHAARQKEGAGAHAGQRAHDWSSETASANQMALHARITSLKSELAALDQAKHLAKTAVLKRQKALKDVARIAAHLAKQPHVPADAISPSGFAGSSGNHAPSSSPSKRSSSSSGKDGELTKAVSTLRTSNELLRLQIEDLQAHLSQLKAVELSRSSGAREKSSLERERSELVQAVSIGKASRDLDDFKRGQVLADLRFAVAESERTLEARRKEAAATKMNTQAMEQQNEQLQHEYHEMQQQLDAWAASQVR
jgi:hypothetical protein